VVEIDGMGWKQDLTRECVEPNPGFDESWSKDKVNVWLKGLAKDYPFAPHFAGLDGETLFGFSEG